MIKKFQGIRICAAAITALCAVLSLLIFPMPVYASVSGFSVGEIAGFSIAGREDGIGSVSTSNERAVEIMAGLLKGASRPVPAPENPVHAADMTLLSWGGGITSYRLLNDENGLYASRGQTTLKLDASEFNRLMGGFRDKLYPYRAVPALTLNGTEIWKDAGNYAYKRLDGRFIRPGGQVQLDLLNIVGVRDSWPAPEFSVQPQSVAVKVFDNGREVFSGTWEMAGRFARAEKKTYRVEAQARFRHDYYRGVITYVFETDPDSGAVSKARFSIEGSATYPGELMVLRVHNAAPGDIVTFSGNINFTPQFFSDGEGGKIALMPVSYFTSAGTYFISLNCKGESVRWDIAVRGKNFQIQNMTISQSTANSTVNSTAANAEYERVAAPLRRVTDSRAYWDGFVWPAPGVVSTEFGMIRYVNNSPTSTRHGGIDIANSAGTDIKAAANGRVLYAGYLQLTGYTIIIEHGLGLKSWYYHMNSVSVETGGTVKMGQSIGKMGSTGFSTGPHLHFAMSVNNVWVNPETVINTDLIKKAA
ncbi:MAG: M23 family metallopeptidase [Oscillospiraceae bacterium]|nr:M23 family metallopeptidase [Oscillospiraceae bacterium]